MFYYVYLLESLKSENFYVGYTVDLKKRLEEHNRGLTPSTKVRRPWRFIHFEAYRNVKDAARREKYLKTSQGSRTLKLMLREYFKQKKESNFTSRLPCSEVRSKRITAPQAARHHNGNPSR